MSTAHKELYVSLNPKVYRSSKASGLQAQASFLKIMKHLHNLKVLSRQKRDLREYLFKQFDSVIKEVNKIEDKFPAPEIPDNLRRKIKRGHGRKRDVDKLDLKIKRDYSKRDQIDDELFEIQKKLASLNG